VNILGVSAFYHDSAACLVRDGEIVAAAQEERFSRKKHDERFPVHAVDYCLEEGGLAAADLDLVAFYDKPLLKFDRLLETYVAMAPRGFGMFVRGLPVWLHRKLYTSRELDRGLNRAFGGRYIYTEHHESHAASAFFPSPYDEAAIITLDGVGEWATGSIGHGRGNRITLLKELRFPHSLGLLYSAFTYFTGFRVNSGEYKLMGLAPYGEPVYKDLILEHLIDLRDDGSFRMDMSYFGYCHDDVMTTPKFDALFGGPPRQAESKLTAREMNLAASIQAVTEEVMLRVARHAAALTGSSNLVLAGGVALNCVGNGRILREGPFERVWIQPAAGDAGGALGAALFVWHQLLDRPRQPDPVDSQHGSLLGPRCESADIRAHLDSVGASYDYYADEPELAQVVAGLIADQRVVGHVAGRMEFGPRALGARSILGDARSPEMQTTMNVKIKFRESFRPFAPVVLRERVHEFFEMRPGEDSPYMLLVAPVQADKRLKGDADGDGTRAEGFDRLKLQRSVIPAVTHVDGSARVQTVDAIRAPRLHAILSAFERQTGCPVMINTSFNVRGEPIVCTPADAYRCFMATDMDALVIENYVLLKERQPTSGAADRERYLAEFALD
jgi:carbamoyltransferase